MYPHLQALRRKTLNVLGKLTRMVHSVWGLRYPVMRTYYRTIFLPMMTYAAGAWADRVDRRHTRQVLSSQRTILIRLTKAYSTSSTESLQVVAGCLPLDLQLQLTRQEYLYSRKGFRRIGGLDLTECPKSEAKTRLREGARRRWELRWRETDKADVTHDFFRTIRGRLQRKWMSPTHAETQFYTGHGHFQHKLWSLNLARNPLCDCGEVDTPAHMLYSCGLYQDMRDTLVAAATAEGAHWPLPLSDMLERNTYPVFQETVNKMMSRKKDLWAQFNFAEA